MESNYVSVKHFPLDKLDSYVLFFDTDDNRVVGILETHNVSITVNRMFAREDMKYCIVIAKIKRSDYEKFDDLMSDYIPRMLTILGYSNYESEFHKYVDSMHQA